MGSSEGCEGGTAGGGSEAGPRAGGAGGLERVVVWCVAACAAAHQLEAARVSMQSAPIAAAVHAPAVIGPCLCGRRGRERRGESGERVMQKRGSGFGWRGVNAVARLHGEALLTCRGP